MVNGRNIEGELTTRARVCDKEGGRLERYLPRSARSAPILTQDPAWRTDDRY